jgi:flagellar assembly factor FliW
MISADIIIDHILATTEPKKKQITSRFGVINLNLAKTLAFNNGLLGVVDKMDFCLAEFPAPIFGNFKILQSVDDDNLSFIVLPIGDISVASNFIHEEDLLEASNNLKINPQDVIILLITSVSHINDIEGKSLAQISVNMKAPLIIDSKNLTGNQYILLSDKYQIQHIIS